MIWRNGAFLPGPSRSFVEREILQTRYLKGFVAVVLLGCTSVDTKPMAESAKLRSADGEAGDYFGYALSTDGAHTIVGAYGDDDRGTNAGAAYIFATRNRNWNEEAKLIPLQAIPNEQVGMAVAISGDFAWVGSRGDIEQGPQTGSAYVFRRLDEGWVQVTRFRSRVVGVDDQYGLSIAVDGEIGRAHV